MNKAHEFKSAQLGSSEYTSDEAEMASRDFSINVSIHLHERERTMLLQIDRALGKIENGTYGQCETCKERIELNRLKARPFALLCIDCMEDQEIPRPFPN